MFTQGQLNIIDITTKYFKAPLRYVIYYQEVIFTENVDICDNHALCLVSCSFESVLSYQEEDPMHKSSLMIKKCLYFELM